MTANLFVVFPKSGTGLLHALRGVRHHVSMFDERGDFRAPYDYADRVRQSGECTGHIPYSHDLHSAIKKDGYHIVFLFRNLRDVVVSLVNYVQAREESELNVMAHGVRLSRSADPILDAIDIVAEWWAMFEPWTRCADAVYTFRELRGAALLMGHEEQSFTFATGNINNWRRDFKPHHIEAAQAKLPDVLKDYNLAGSYEERQTA